MRARVTKLVPFGILVRPDDGIAGLVHRSEPPPAEPGLAARLGDEMTVRVTEVGVPMRPIRLSLEGTDDLRTCPGIDAPPWPRP
ncbi:S1 RNA-binding domain-containing protein [Streptomyces sp. NPDC006711]|uniref:S1 RNA-binding domain-containing protein n=1 Tax=unclassified Streptomyces TaxID=2593676 RepID=UPI0033C97F68